MTVQLGETIQFDETYAPHHFEIERISEGGDEFYVAGIVETETGRAVEAVAMVSASLCDTDAYGKLYENWVLYFLGNLLLDIGSHFLKVDRNELMMLRAKDETRKTEALFVKRRDDG